MSAYQPYRNLPPLAGLGTFEDAAKPGLSVEACVSRLKRYHYALKRLHFILTARITGEPIYELKSAFSLHAWLCAEHIAAVRERVGEMREPPLGLEETPDPSLAVFFDEILGAATTAELVVGVYEKALPALLDGLRRHIADTNPLADYPSVRVCRLAAVELEDMVAYGAQAVAALVSDEDRAAMAAWLELLDTALAAAGELDGTQPRREVELVRQRSATPYVFDRIPRRDERFEDLFNQGVNAEGFLYDPNMPLDAKVLMMFFKRIREIDVPEMMARIIVETEGQPWDYYLAMSRQLWDEARHAMMGEVGFVSVGVDWTRTRVTHNWCLRLNTECTPLEAHAVLYFIEQGLMNRTGKRYEWEVGMESGNPLSATFQDYDWADEVLHANIGRDWLVPQCGTREDAIAFGDKAWSRILSNWRQVLDEGLTQHANWWPAVYRQYCENRGIEPDPRVLAYDETYEGKRADLNRVAVDG